MKKYRDYYDILGVTKDASNEEIQRAYRKLARQFHPDINKQHDAEERFKEINEAYQVLKDAKKRKLFDMHGDAWKAAEQGRTPPPEYDDMRFGRGPQWQESSFSGSGDFFDDLFEQLFGAAGMRSTTTGRARGVWVVPGEDREARITLYLEEAAQGGRRSISFTDPVTGEKITYDINIPSGLLPGQRIRLPGLGGKGLGGAPPGDLYLIIDIAPHPYFRLKDKVLYVTLSVEPWQAALGKIVDIPTLMGSERIKLPSRSSSGQRIRLRERGYPAKEGRGDLIAELKIVIPEHLSLEEIELYKALAEISQEKSSGGLKKERGIIESVIGFIKKLFYF